MCVCVCARARDCLSRHGVCAYGENRYLTRLEPYTELSRALHGGRLDLPDRMFWSVAEVCMQAVVFFCCS